MPLRPHVLFGFLLAVSHLDANAHGSTAPDVGTPADVAAAELAAQIKGGEHQGIVAMRIAHRGVDIDADAPGKQPTQDIRSATKSITALLVGIAIDRGLIPSVETAVADLLPEYADRLRKDPAKARMRVEDLLTMRSGVDCDDWDLASPGHEDRMYRKRDWLAFWSSQPMRDDPGQRFSYCTGNVIALGRIIETASGQSLAAFSDDVLFSPLGIRDAQWAHWLGGKRIDSGGHLRMSADGQARIGQLVLEGGIADGRQIVSRRWLDAMTTERLQIPGQAQRYGYLWWLDATTSAHHPRERLWMAWGNGGNYLIVLPEHGAVVVFQGQRFNQPSAMEPLLWLRDRIMPMLRASASPGAVLNTDDTGSGEQRP